MTGVALTKLDVLDDCETIRIGVGYRHQGRTLSEMPLESAVLEQCEPVYEEMAGWGQSTTGITRFDQLPKQARKYVSRLKEIIGCPPFLISTGSDRDQTIRMEDPFRISD